MQNRDKSGKFLKAQPKQVSEMKPPFQGKVKGFPKLPMAYQMADGVFRTAKGKKVTIKELAFPRHSKQTNEFFYTDIDNNVYKTFPSKHYLVEGHYDLSMCPSDYYNPYTFGDLKKSEPVSSTVKDKALDDLVRLRGKKTETIPTTKTYTLSELLNKLNKNDTAKCNCKGKCQSKDEETDKLKGILANANEMFKDKKVKFVGVLAFGYDDMEDFLENFTADYAIDGGNIMLSMIAKYVKV